MENNESNINNDNNNQENYNEEEDLDEDAYLQELHLRLNQMKQERKNAENEANLLDNRLNMLKNEEEKNWKKIENKKKQTNEKLIYLQNVAEMMKQREAYKVSREIEINKQRELNRQRKDNIKQSTEMKRAEKQRLIHEEMKLLKLQKQYNEQLLEYINNEKVNNNKTKCECIKSQHTIEKERKAIIQHERKMKLRAELEKKLLEEYRWKEEAEEKKNKTEQAEIEVVKRLQTTTQIHKNISDDLDKLNWQSVMNGEYKFESYNNINHNGSGKK